MSKTLIITMQFESDEDFDQFRYRAVGLIEDYAEDIQDKETDPPHAEGKVEVGWDVAE